MLYQVTYTGSEIVEAETPEEATAVVIDDIFVGLGNLTIEEVKAVNNNG